ncbi:STAS/SEC14 domain-containing protein [Methyloprofundus sp.]|uniref:STAS/SEC14 domain-containing protein n=1 Tax=Methyloprofundus sp. TaxID=2020875 RepID=UPI003D0DDDAC
MLTVHLNAIAGIAILQPEGELSAADFASASQIIDPYIESAGKLKGIIIHVQSFPSWDSFAALISHFKFIKDHHKQVSHIALVTDSPVGGFAENIASHFVSAEIKSFAYNQLETAEQWILSTD